MKERKMKKNIHLHVSNDEGFISAYFLVLFMQIIVIFTILLANMNRYLEMKKNISQYTTYIGIENKIIQYLNALETDELIEDTVLINDITFQYEVNEPYITVYISEPIQETMFIECNEDGTIYDYETDRIIN